jgi:hypothetical protein
MVDRVLAPYAVSIGSNALASSIVLGVLSITVR